MSYTTINGMRSARYPLQGCGCGCGGNGGCGGMGDGTLAAAAGGTALVALITVGTIGALWWGTRAPKSYRRAMQSNRRRRRTSRR